MAISKFVDHSNKSLRAMAWLTKMVLIQWKVVKWQWAMCAQIMFFGGYLYSCTVHALVLVTKQMAKTHIVGSFDWPVYWPDKAAI